MVAGTFLPVERLGEKASLRRMVRERREAMSGRARRAASSQVVRLLTELTPPICAGWTLDEVPIGSTVMSYMAFGPELDLGEFHNVIVAAGGRLVVPRVNGRIIEAVECRPGTPLVVSRFGIAEPVGEPIDPLTIDVVLVPAVCFDRRGHRIGYGAGYYDRFLPLTRADCRHIGVAFARQLIDRVPEEPHDRPVGMLITNEEVITVGDS